MQAVSPTPMMSARILKPLEQEKHGRLYQFFERGFSRLADFYGRLLRWALYVASIGAASIAAALCSWHVLEKRFLGLKDRFTR